MPHLKRRSPGPDWVNGYCCNPCDPLQLPVTTFPVIAHRWLKLSLFFFSASTSTHPSSVLSPSLVVCCLPVNTKTSVNPFCPPPQFPTFYLPAQLQSPLWQLWNRSPSFRLTSNDGKRVVGLREGRSTHSPPLSATTSGFAHAIFNNACTITSGAWASWSVPLAQTRL